MLFIFLLIFYIVVFIAELRNLPEIKNFEKNLHTIQQQPSRSTTSRRKVGSRSMSTSPKKALLQKPTKIIQKVAKIAMKKPLLAKKRGRKSRI